MIYIQTHSTDPTWNLALEEYCQTHLTQFPKIFMLWQNANSIIIGRYQNMAREVNIDAAKEYDVKVVRRSTGGGAVYHDLGNLNFSLISVCENQAELDKSQLSKPILDALQRIGIDAEMSGRNDLLLNGKKISGTAQSLKAGRLLHHGTLLFDTDMGILQKVLNVDKTKLESKAISSVRSRVTNIKEELGFEGDIKDFWAMLLEGFKPYQEYELTKEDLDCVAALQKEKYAAWDWLVGAEPAFSYNTEKRYGGGLITLSYNVKNGIIERCRISGDFLGLSDISSLEAKIVGIPYRPSSVREAIEKAGAGLYLGGITADDFIDCMFNCVVGEE